MPTHDLLSKAQAAYEERTGQEERRAERHAKTQEELRAAVVGEKSTSWSAFAAEVLFDKNQAGLVNVDWAIPATTYKKWDILVTQPGQYFHAEPRGSADTEASYAVSAPLGDGISLLLILTAPELYPEFLAIKLDDHRDYTKVTSLADVGAAVASAQNSSR